MDKVKLHKITLRLRIICIRAFAVLNFLFSIGTHFRNFAKSEPWKNTQGFEFEFRSVV